MLIQLYNGVKDNTGTEIEIATALQKISGAQLQKPIANLRKAIHELASLKAKGEDDKEEFNKDAWQKLVAKKELDIATLKQKLPAVTWSGTFATRSIKGLTQYSQLICLDIDKLSPEHLFDLRKKICNDPHTHICFTSPSGTGIKVIFKVNGNADQHKACFLSIEKYFVKKHTIKIDPSGKDVSRLCFLSHDQNLYVNNDAFHYVNFEPEVTDPVKPFTSKEVVEFEAAITCQDVFNFTEKKVPFTTGNRHRFLFLFCNNCNRKGIPMNECADFALQTFTTDSPKTISQSVENAYNLNTHEHGKYAKKSKAALADAGTKDRNTSAEKSDTTNAGSELAQAERAGGAQGFAAIAAKAPSSNGTTEKPIQFWKERKITKGKDKNQYTVILYELQRVEFTDFLFQQGFHLIDTDAKGYQICHSAHGIIEPVDARVIKKQVFAWCKKNVVRDVEEMVRKGQKQFFAANEMDSLHTKKIQFKTDTEMESYFYFKNCWVTVTAEQVTTHNYNELSEYIWAGNKKDHDFTVQQPQLFTQNAEAKLTPAAMDCEFAKFVYYCAYNPDSIEEKDFDQENILQRFQCFCTSIGFLLDGYKHPANRKSIFALDHKIGERNEQHGRTGKSIIPKACEKLKVVSHINGKSYDTKYQFRNEPITADAQIIDFNDMQRNFDPDNIFEIIADDYSVNRRNNGFLFFKYETSPKVYYSTNAIPKGEGGSYTGRMHIIEFSDYFTPTNTPYDEFGHGLLGAAWDQDEWNRFYNFMLFCVQQFKSDGLVAYPKSNFDARKMANELDVAFVDFMDDETEVPRNKTFLKKPFMKKLIEYMKEETGNDFKQNMLFKWLKRYCKSKKLFFNPHKPGPENYDKRNKIEYYTIATTEDFKPTDIEPTLFDL